MKKLLVFILPLIVISCFSPSICSANAAQPPTILIIVQNAPNDLEISTGDIKAHRTDKATESYFTLYAYNYVDTEATVTITTGDRTFEVTIESLETYNNIFTLDLERQTLTPGKALSRSITLVSLRLFLTLIIEAIVLYLFGYRRKNTWLTFLIINLITQGFLSIWLHAGTNPLDSYIIFTLIIGEIFVFIVEMVLFLILIREHHRLRIALYVITANLISLIAGGYLLTILPV